MAIDTAEELLSVLDFDPATTPGIPFPYSALGTPERLHLLWLYSGLFEDGEREPTPVPAPSIPLQRWLVRTAQFDQLGESQIEDFRISVKRGIGDNSEEPHVRFRFNRDNKGFGKWIRRGLGKTGDRFSTINIGPLGTAHVWQFEVTCDDDCDVELQAMEAIIKRIGH